MNANRRLSLVERAAAGALNVVTYLGQGSTIPTFKVVVQLYGLKGFGRWLKAISTMQSTMVKRYGDTHSQILFGLAGLWNGCGFCAFGHIYTANLMIYRDDGVLCPLNQFAIEKLFDMTDDEAIEYIRTLLADERYTRLRELIVRQFEIRMRRAEGETEDDPYLQLSLSSWDWLNECSIVEGVHTTRDTLAPFAPIGWNKKLIAAYREARDAAYPAGT